jgi:hypothetical protein
VEADIEASKRARKLGKGDADHCLEQGLDTSTKVAESVKDMFVTPIEALEDMGNDMMRLVGREPRRPMGITGAIRKTVSPYQTHVEQTAAEVRRKQDELEAGESSDDDWLHDRPREKSTGRGLRHRFFSSKK